MIDWNLPQDQVPGMGIGIVDDKIMSDLHDDYQPSLEEVEYLDTYQFRILLLFALEGIAKRSISSLSFQGMRRKLELHQQILTKALNRLVNKQLIFKSSGDNHYLLTEKGQIFLQNILKNAKKSKSDKKDQWKAIERTYSTQLSADEFLNTFLGRWFGEFRWVGWFKDMDSIKMEWISEDNSYEAIASHEGRKQELPPYTIKTFLVQKSSADTVDDLQDKLERFNSHFNKILSETGPILKEEEITATPQFTQSAIHEWFDHHVAN